MTALFEQTRSRPADGGDPALRRPAIARTSRRSLGSGVRTRLQRNGRSLLWLLPLLALTAVARAVNLAGTPQRFDDEGTYVAQAYAVLRWGALSHYTYWYDHPPVGWMQIAGYLGATGALDRHSSSVAAGREAMVAAAVISALMLWMLVRRIGFGRPTAALAVTLMAVSPLAVQFQKSVYLDNVATPWLLATFVLLTTRRRSLSAFVGAGLCFAVAVLSKETYLLAAPAVVWVALRSAPRSTRRYGLSLAAAVFALVLSCYGVLALLKGELLPGPGHVSLTDGIAFQLVRRVSSGNVLDPSSLAHQAVAQWLSLDAVLPAAAAIAAVIGLFSTRLRPFAAMYLGLLAVIFRPGYLPVPYVIMLIPFAALLVAGALDLAVTRGLSRVSDRPSGSRQWRWRRGWTAVPAVLAAVAALVVAVPSVVGQYRGLWGSDPDLAAAQAQSWMATNIVPGQKVITDDAFWLDLVRAGQPRQDVVWYYKVDTDPAVGGLAPDGWRDYTWIVSTQSLRQFPATFPIVSDALDHSYVVASFGSGNLRVDVRRVDPQAGTTGAVRAANRAQPGQAAQARRQPTGSQANVNAQVFRQAAAQRAAAGGQLAANTAVRMTGSERKALTSGQVDLRVDILLAQLATTGPVQVVDLPVVPGESPPATARRTFVLTGTPARLATLRAGLSVQRGVFQTTLSTRPNGDLVAVLPLLDPAQQRLLAR